MEFSEVKRLFESFNQITKKLKRVEKPIEDKIVKIIIFQQITGYKTTYHFNKNDKNYLFMITCDNTNPTFGKSKSFVEARSLAHKNLFHNINMANSCFEKELEEDQRYPDKILSERLNSELKNPKASQKEKDEEEF